MNQFPEHTFALKSTVYRDGVAGTVVRRLYLVEMADESKSIQCAYEVQFTDGRRLILDETELS